MFALIVEALTQTRRVVVAVSVSVPVVAMVLVLTTLAVDIDNPLPVVMYMPWFFSVGMPVLTTAVRMPVLGAHGGKDNCTNEIDHETDSGDNDKHPIL